MAASNENGVQGRPRPSRPKRKTLKDEVAVYVREQILGGDWSAGTKVDLDEIGAPRRRQAACARSSDSTRI